MYIIADTSGRAVCGRSPAEIVGSNPTGEMNICLLWALCVVRQRSLRQADHSSREVLPTVVCRCVWSSNLVNEEALAHWGLLHQKKCTTLDYISVYQRCIYCCREWTVKFSHNARSNKCQNRLTNLVIHYMWLVKWAKQLTAKLRWLFISVFNQLDVQNLCFTIRLFHATTCF